jgi:hypothetical protein
LDGVFGVPGLQEDSNKLAEKTDVRSKVMRGMEALSFSFIVLCGYKKNKMIIGHKPLNLGR